jgi:hypothetical protein
MDQWAMTKVWTPTGEGEGDDRPCHEASKDGRNVGGSTCGAHRLSKDN